MLNIDSEIQKIAIEAIKYQTKRGVMVDSMKHKQDGDIFEFGVFKGASLKLISDLTIHNNTKIYAFDSFEGLPEAWPGSFASSHPKGHFNVNGKIPNINNSNITYVKGFFENTLPDFIKTYEEKSVSLLHIDCDIYSSTKTIFSYMKNFIKPGLVIVFDELIGYDGFELNEMKAWLEFLQDYPIEYKYLYSCKYGVSLKIL
jgi:hypothetical protein